MRKILSICLCLALVLVGGLTLAACGKEKAKTMSEQEFLNAIKNASEAEETGKKVVKLTGDVTLTKAVELTKAVTIDLNGHKIGENVTYAPADDDSTETMFLIKEGGNLTVKGDGKVETDDLIMFWLKGTTKAGTQLKIESGEYVGDESDVVYVTTGTAKVTGGTYKIDTNVDFTLNIKDGRETANADIVVEGGTFYGFNPAAPKSNDKESYINKSTHKSEQTAENSNVWIVTAKAE